MSVIMDVDFEEKVELLYPDQAELMVAVNELFALSDDVEDTLKCIEKLDHDLGITDADDLQDRYFYETDHYDPCEEFAEHYVMEMCDGENLLKDAGMMPWLIGCIDFEAVWNTALRYDFNEFDYNDVTYFFLNH